MAIPIPEKRIAEFEKLGFGMIIHWGLYGQVGFGERFSEFCGYPRIEYEKLTETFTASKFDAHKMGENGKLYFYVHDLYGRFADDNGPLPGGGTGDKTFTGIPGKIKSIRWTDVGDKWIAGNGELSFMQEGDKVVINCTGYPYGKNAVVRVAEAELE